MSEHVHTTKDASCVYTYPGHFFYVEVLLFSLIGTLLLFAWVPAVMSLLTYGNILASALRAAVFLNVTAIALVLLLLFIKNEMRTTVFILSDTDLTHKTAMGMRRIALSQIRRLSFVSFPLSGGVMTVDGGSGQKVIHIPLFVQNSSDLVDRLEALCRDRVEAVTASDATMQILRRKSRLSAMAYRRSSKAFQPVVSLCIAMLPINILIGVFFWDMSIISLAVWAVAGPFFPIAGFTVADIIIRGFEKKAVEKSILAPIKSFEETVVARTSLVVACCYCIVAILYKSVAL